MTTSTVSIKDLNFSYKNQQLFSGLNLEINSNQFIGIVGANGSGKSTLLKLILGLLKPENGKITVLDLPAGSFSGFSQIGSSLQEIDFPNTETVEEVLNFVSKQYPSHTEKEDLIARFNLNDFRHKPTGQLSGGMKRRLSLACAFSGQPKVVILDEPSTGLDPKSRQSLMQSLRDYQKQNQALILMISHHPEEIIGYVDSFLHLKDSQVNRISPEQMQVFANYRKISFFSEQNPEDIVECEKITRDGSKYEMIVKSSDRCLRDLCLKKFPFNDLQVEKLQADQLIEEIL